MSTDPRITPSLTDLVDLFYPDSGQLGQFDEVAGADLPEDFRRLLDHNHHMTVTVEEFHKSPVNVEVIKTKRASPYYSRKILLRRQSDLKVVQFGIVRLNFDYLQQPVRDEIVAEGTPLGRILIQHNVLREVELSKLWQVRCGAELQNYFDSADTTFGRTALIYCNGDPAVELLEIVSLAG